MIAKDFRELRVYQSAFQLALKVHEITKSFPKEERYSLIDQMRRSSRSVCLNIAESWRKRRYPNSFVSELSDADAEAAETIVSLDFAFHFGYIPAELREELCASYETVCKQLTLMMDQPHKWTPQDKH